MSGKHAQVESVCGLGLFHNICKGDILLKIVVPACCKAAACGGFAAACAGFSLGRRAGFSF